MSEITVLADTTEVPDPYTIPLRDLEEFFLSLGRTKFPFSSVNGAISIFHEGPPMKPPVELPANLALREIVKLVSTVTPILTTKRVVGGVIKKFRPVLKKQIVETVESESSFETSFNDPTRVLRDNVSLIVAANELVVVAGIRVASESGVTINGVTIPAGGYADFYTNDSRTFLEILKHIYTIRRLNITDDSALWAVATNEYATGREITRRLAELRRENMLETVWIPADMEPVVEDSAFLQMVAANLGFITLGDTMATSSRLAQFRLVRAYLMAMELGADDDAVNAATMEQINRIAVERRAGEYIAGEFRRREQLATYTRILHKILSTSRVSKVNFANLTTLNASLTAGERDRMLAEAQREAKFVEAVLNNNCPHVSLYQRLRRAITADDKQRLLRELSTYYNKSQTTTMKSCSRCKFDIICPHYVDEIENMRKPPGERRKLVQKYIDGDSRAAQQYCKICGEILYSRLELHEDVEPNENFDEELRMLVWSEIMTLIRTVEFEHPVDVIRLVDDIRKSIYSAASTIDAEVSRNQSYSSVELSHRRSLFISFLAMAKIVQIMSTEPGMKFIKHKQTRDINKLIDFGAEVVYYTKNISIRAVPGITTDAIRIRIKHVIALLGQRDIAVENEQTQSVEALAAQITNDPTYGWISALGGKQKFAAIMGASPAELHRRLRSGKSVYSFATLPSSPDEYVNASFKHWMKYVLANGIPVYAIADGETVYNAAYAAYMAESARIHKLELKFDRSRVVGAFRNWSRRGIRGIARALRIPITIGELYDEDGRKHEFTVYIIGGREYPMKELKKAQESGKIAEITKGADIRGAIEDRACSVCGVRESLAKKLNVAKIRASLSQRNEIDSLTRFYATRCPAGGTHTGDKCTKCGRAPGDQLNYYRKWRDTFIAERSEIHQADDEVPPAAPEETLPVVKWLENFGHVVQIAKIGDIHPRQIQAIGAYDKVDTADIISGKYVPMRIEDRDHTRVGMVNSIVIGMLSSWSRVRNYASARSRDPYIAEIVGSADRSSLLQLEDVSEGYYALFKQFYNNEPADRIVTMCIQEWCSRLLRIYEGSEVGKRFVKSQITLTIEAQELVTTREPFNWSIVFGNKTVQQDTVDIGGDVGEQTEEDESFSLDAFDVEGEVNIRAGDNYGLD